MRRNLVPLLFVPCLALQTWHSWGCTSGTSNTEGVLPGVKAIVFAKRAYVEESGEHNVAGGSGRVVDYRRYTPGGGVFVLEPPTPDGALTELTSKFEGVDIAGLDLSFDGKEVVFSMRHEGDDGHYHIYTTKVDGSGKTRQLTFGMYDDVRPIYVPGDRIAFVTNQSYTPLGTRADEYNHGREVTQIATISSVAGDADRRVCAQNLSHAADPFLMSDGTIGYSRWEHLGPVNDLKLFRMNPDCTDMLALAGQHGKGFNSIVQTREAEPGVVIGIATAREGTIQAGAIMRIDARARSGSADLDEQTATFDSLTPDVPMGREPSGVGRYRTPYALDKDGRLLVSWADGDVSDRTELANTAPHFGVYLYDPKTDQRVRVYDDPEFWDMYAMPVRSRPVPRVRGDVLDVPDSSSMDPFGSAPATLGSIDIASTSLNETVSGGQFGSGMPLRTALEQTEKVRIIEGFSSEIGSVREFGLTMHEGAAILAEVPVQKDRSWQAQVIPYLPYHLQAVDRFGLAIRNEMLWIQAMPGETRTCGGCHESRSAAASATQGNTLAAQLDLDYSRVAIADRTELPWAGAASGGNLQDLFDAKCANCHGGGANDPFAGRFYTVTVPPEEDAPEGAMPMIYQIPYLLLTSAPVETYYEREVVTYPASYVTLLYPSAMMGDSVVEGDMPPTWVVPGSARQSRLIEKLNATPNDERAGSEWAWSTPAHPEDVGVSLTPAERLKLIQMADLGGQYFSRRNVPNAAQWLSVGTAADTSTTPGQMYNR